MIPSELPLGLEDIGTYLPGTGLVDHNGKLVNLPQSEGELHGLKNPTILWEKGEGEDSNYFFPVITLYVNRVPVKEVGNLRSAKEFLPGEKALFLQLFTNHISKIIFGSNCYLVSQDHEGYTHINVNPKFKG